MTKNYLYEYSDQAAYEADAVRKNIKESTVSKVGEKIVYDGVNVETSRPEFADAVYHDANNKVHFIKGNTVDTSVLPADYVPIGTCGVRRGGSIYIIYKSYEYLRFAMYCIWDVTGWVLDGAPHTCETVKLRNQVLPAFTYTATTLEECATQLDTFLRANTSAEKPHIAYMENGVVKMQLLKYGNWDDVYATISSLTTKYDLLPGLTSVPNMHVLNGRNNLYGLWSLKRALEYFRDDNTNGSFNPTSVISSEPSYPTCLPAYLGTSAHRDGDKCAWLRAKYGEGEEGWLNYMRQLQPKYPYPKGMVNEHQVSGKEMTYLLAGTKKDNGSGELVNQFPAIEYVAGIGFAGVQGLEQGDWFGPNAEEFYASLKDITYGLKGINTSNCDELNKTRARMNISLLSCATYSWLFSRYYAYSCWLAGSLGYVVDSGLYYGSRVVPFALYHLGED